MTNQTAKPPLEGTGSLPFSATRLLELPQNSKGYACSMGQIGMRAASSRYLDQGIYVEQVLIRFTEPPQEANRLQAAWFRTVAAIPALRAVFEEDDQGYPRIFIKDDVKIDWRTDSGSDPDWLERDRIRPFEPGTPASRCRYRPKTGDWLWTFHHSLLDGRAITNVLKAFLLPLAEMDPGVPPVWCGSLISNEDQKPAAQAAWSSLASATEDEPEQLSWNGMPGAGGIPHRIHLTLSAEAVTALPAAAKAAGTTPHNLLQWAWGFTLARVFSQEQPVMGVVRSGHWAVEPGKEAAGYLMATLPVPVTVDPQATLGKALADYRDAILKVRDFVAVDTKVAAAALGRPSKLPWDAVIMTENGSLKDTVLAVVPQSLVTSVQLLERTGEPLSASAWLGSQPAIEIEANPELFSAEASEVLAKTWQRAIELAVTSPPGTKLADLEPFPAALLEQLAATESDGPALAADGLTIWQAFDRMAETAPGAIALGYEGKEITYAELKLAAESLAGALYSAGVRSGDRVASRIDARRHASVVVLACARLQAVYMPFDADIPPERVQRMIEVAEPKAIIRDGPEEEATKGLPAVHPEEHGAGVEGLPAYQPHDPYEPFCLLFTSGSTGEPKGVINHHHGILNEVLAVGRMLDIGQNDRVLQFASLGFDAALEEILGTLVAGAKLVPREEAILESFDKYQAFISEQGISIADLPTAYWAAWCAWLAEHQQRAPGCVRGVIIGGEKAGAASTLAWNRSCDGKIPVYNTYGPTETAIVATASRLAIPEDGGDPPIGRPLPGLRARIVAKSGRVAAPGKVGELWLGGAGVGLGYWKRPERTAESFVTEPGSERPDWYRTGDMARMDAKGVLHFLGRADDQVKIRGKRIEPGEIQARLETHPQVRRAHVGARSIKGHMTLVAWLVAPGEDAASLTAFLKKDLPGWMIPSGWVFLDELPLNARGKVDRKKLPDPAAVTADSDGEAAQGEGTPLEIWMASLFAEVLGVDAATVRYDLDFAEQGGDSLSAMALATRLRQAGVDLDPGELVADSSPKALADKIHNNYGKARTEWDPILRLRAGNPENPPLVLLHATPGDVLGYANLVAELPRSIPCLGVVSRSLHLPDQPHETIEEMAAAYIEALTPKLEGKPWILGGWCYGGIVAYEMARQLIAAGKPAPMVIMIEAWAQAPADAMQGLKLKAAKALAVLSMPGAVRKKWLEARKHHQVVAEGPAENSEGFARSAVYQANMKAMNRHRMGSYTGEVHVFLSDNAAVDGTVPLPYGGWHVLGAKTTVHSHGGNHALALRPPYVKDLAAGIVELLKGEMKVG